MSDLAVSMRVHQLPLRVRLLIWVGSILIKLLCATLRFQLEDQSKFFSGPYPKPAVTLIWHNRILAMPAAFRRYYRNRKGLVVLTSASRDGAYLSEFVRCFGMGSVRGSSSRRGAAAMLDLVRTVEEGFDICITPDGPRGPRYKLSPGALVLAERCGVPLMPISVEYSAFWRLNSWDGFAIPKPFSRVSVILLPMIDVNVSKSEGIFDEKLKMVETRMVEHMIMK